MVRELVIVKVPRSDRILDKPANFVDLKNLHLDLIEVKKKLKRNLPPVILNKNVSTRPQQNIEQSIIIPTVVPTEQNVNEGTEAATENEEYDAANEEESMMIEELGEGNGGGGAEEPTDVAEEQQIVPGEPDPYENMTEEERDAHEKEEYIWRFKILKKQYKERDIPSFNEHDDLPFMKTTYERTLKEIKLETNVDSYRTYLVGGFMVMEFVFTNMIGADLTGFTTQQMAMMDKYDIMLIELGERSYNRWGTSLPIEIRLIGFIFMQAGLFYLGKIIADKAGMNIATIFGALSGQPIPTQSVSTGQSETSHKKMRGPSIKVSDIKRSSDD